jgi:hypothetical protein
MSEILTIHGELQGTLGFHEAEPIGNEFTRVGVAWAKEAPPSEAMKAQAKTTRTNLRAKFEPAPSIPPTGSICKMKSLVIGILLRSE